MGQSETPTQNAEGWMVGGQEILFHWVPVPQSYTLNPNQSG
jgi:hypothetical protein